MLTPQGVEELGELMRRLRDQGVAIIFITHKLSEAAAFGDRISVLQLGRKVGEIAPERLRSLRRGGRDRRDRRPDVRQADGRSGRRAAMPGTFAQADAAPLLAVRDLSVAPRRIAPGLSPVSFDIWPGEMLGIAGIDGNGQKQLAEALAGQRARLRRVDQPRRPADRALSVGERRGGRAALPHRRPARRRHGRRFPVATNFC